MEYELAVVATQNGLVIGYAIKKTGLPKFESVNIYQPDEVGEARDDIRDLNKRAALREFWPTPDDLEVQALINDPDFCPVEYDEVDTIDMENSTLVYDEVPSLETGGPSINWPASEVVYKKEFQPKRTQEKSRIELASQHVAHARLERANV